MRERGRIDGFTIIELLIVIAVIIILAGLVLGTSSYVQNKGARSRAQAEIAAMSAALESYKADNGEYPQFTGLNARASGAENPDAQGYRDSSIALYNALFGVANAEREKPADSTTKTYFTFKPNMLSPPPPVAAITFIRDPFGNSYGYSTANQGDPAQGYNPTFDLWSTGGETEQDGRPKWITNW